MIEYMVYIWVAFLIFSIVTEAATMSLVAVWFMPGALLSMILAFFGVAVWIQVLLFFVISVVLLLLTRKISSRLQKRKPLATNADRVIGSEGIVTEEIDDIQGTGQVKVFGQIWSAKNQMPNETLKAGSIVKILQIEGVKLIVTPKI